MSLLAELKRRNVVRVGIAYIVAAWLLLQLTDVLVDLLGLPDTAGKLVVLLLTIGFIPALIFAWAFEMTPEGIKREKDVERSESIAVQTGRKLDYAIVGILALALVYFVWESRFSEKADMGSEPFSQDSSVQMTENDGEKRDPTPVVAEVEAATIEPSIAVLAFADLSPLQDQGYFSDGIAEELLNLLARVDGLKVASRTSSFAYKGSAQSLAEIARELKVDHVLEGSVRKADNRIRITAQLIDAKTDRHLWSETFDRELVDIFAIQDEIANAIVAALREELGMLQNAPAITVTAATANLDAYEIYLKARGLFIARDKLEECIALFEQAVELDPDFARAWEGLAAVYSVAESWNITDRQYSQMALVAARTALDLNPDLSMPYAVLGAKADHLERDMVKSIVYFERAIEADPKNTTAYLWRGISWASLGFFDKAIDDCNACLDLDPNYENCRRHLARFHLLAGHNDLAMQLFLVSAERGFYGSNEAFSYELLKRGNRLAVVLGIWQWNLDDRTYPAKVYIDALEFPQQDHSANLAKFLNWVKTQADNPDPSYWIAEMLALGGFEYVKATDFGNIWLWQEENKPYRQSEYFKPMVRKLGLLAYWREKGFPPHCRPVDEDDFECDP